MKKIVKLTEEQIADIKMSYRTGKVTVRDIQSKYGIGGGRTSAILYADIKCRKVAQVHITMSQFPFHTSVHSAL